MTAERVLEEMIKFKATHGTLTNLEILKIFEIKALRELKNG